MCVYHAHIFYHYLNCSNTVVSIFPPPLSPTPSTVTSHSPSFPLWLCPWDLYTCSLMTLALLPSIMPLPPPLWSLSVCSLFPCLWLCFACWFVLLIRFHLQVRSYGICLSLPDLFHLAQCSPIPSMLLRRVGAPSFFLLHRIPLCKCTIVF